MLDKNVFKLTRLFQGSKSTQLTSNHREAEYLQVVPSMCTSSRHAAGE